MHDSPAQPSGKRIQPKEWGVLSATFWSIAAFFAPQFALVPFIDFFARLAVDQNAKIFMFQGIAQLATLLVLWLVVRKVYHSSLKVIGLARFSPGLLWWALLAFPLYLAASIAVSTFVGAVFGINLNEQQDIGYTDPNGYELALIFVALVILAPFVEEVLFRGFLFTAFRRTFGFWIGAIGVSLIFAVAHGQANVGIDVFVLSLFLCYLREKTDTLWTAVALHSVKNLVAFVLLFIMKVS